MRGKDSEKSIDKKPSGIPQKPERKKSNGVVAITHSKTPTGIKKVPSSAMASWRKQVSFEDQILKEEPLPIIRLGLKLYVNRLFDA
jgi:hypothetical protein